MLTILILSVVPCTILCLPEPEAGLSHQHVSTLSRMKRAGACTTTADCVAGNVCSKWGWCQWTTIYGSDGPSQGSAAPGGGKAGQCATSADCASRVPYCSKLGFCHGGRLPFDEAQLEIPDGDKTADFPQQPQGYINNDPTVNNPLVAKNKNKNTNNRNKGNGQNRPRQQKGQNTNSSQTKRNQTSNNRPKQNQGSGQNRSSNNRKGGRNQNNQQQGQASGCPGGTLEACTDACVPIKQVRAYGQCVETCGKRC